MSRLVVASLAVVLGCAGKLETSADDAAAGDSGPSCEDSGGAPAIDCPPLSGPTPSSCSSLEKVRTCPTDDPCMAPVRQSGPVLSHRIGRLRFWEPSSLLNLAAIAFDRNVNAHCANSGTEGLSWLLRIDRERDALATGSARPSSDGRTFTFVREAWSGDVLSSACPGFAGPPAPMEVKEMGARTTKAGAGFLSEPIAELNLALFDSSGVPTVLPLREVTIRADSIADPTCIGAWDAKLWCDGETLGWTTGGIITAKISVADADRVPVRDAGCQSLCAILVNDATYVDGKVCRRGPDGKVDVPGTDCLGGSGCKNAFRLGMSFASYGVTITP